VERDSNEKQFKESSKQQHDGRDHASIEHHSKNDANAGG